MMSLCNVGVLHKPDPEVASELQESKPKTAAQVNPLSKGRIQN